MSKMTVRYAFEHVVLRKLIFDVPFLFWGAVYKEREDFINFLKTLWSALEGNGSLEKVEVENLTFGVSMGKISDDYRMLIIRMPKPKVPLDVIDIFILMGKAETRYFTAELTSHFCEEDGKVVEKIGGFILGEWTRQGGHINYGDFHGSVQELLEKINKKDSTEM